MKIYLHEYLTHEYFHTQNFPNLQYLYLMQLNISNSVTIKILYSICISTWVLLFILQKYHIVPHIYS